MKNLQKKIPALLAVLLIALLFTTGNVRAAKYPKSIRLSQKSMTLMVGKSKKLGTVLAPSVIQEDSLTWKSSDPEVATVSSSGKVKAVSPGKAKITVTTANGKRASCTVKSVCYEVKGNKIHVWTPQGNRTYRRYHQTAYSQNYYPAYGCILTTVSIASSGYGKNYSPKQIHTGSASAKYSERYALKKMKKSGSARLSDYAAISVRTASQILKDIGIPNKPVYTFTKKQAVQDITKHLQSGRPVIVKANNKKRNGVRIANGHHAILLIGLDKEGYITFIDPTNADINYAHGSNTTCSLTLEELVKYHMDPAKGAYSGPYMTSLKTAGGYILIG